MEKQVLADIIKRYKESMFTINRKLNALIREMMPEDITPDQSATLGYIRQHGRCTPSELAEAFCVGKSSITAIVTRLNDKKLIQREPDERDRRVIYLALTPEGERLADELELKIQEMLAQFIGHFDEQEAKTFLETYEKLARVLGEPADRSDKEV